MTVEKTRLLLVEDDALTRELLSAALEFAGFDVIVALDGMHALRSVNVARPDVVLLDFVLPKLAGDAFVAQWRKRDRLALEVPIIVISGHEQAQALASDIRAAAFIPKPFDIHDVVSAVSRLVPPRVVAEAAIGGSVAAAIKIGEVRTTGGRTLSVCVRPEGEAPFVVDIRRTGQSVEAIELTAQELEVFLTLLDMAGRQRPPQRAS